MLLLVTHSLLVRLVVEVLNFLFRDILIISLIFILIRVLR